MKIAHPRILLTLVAALALSGSPTAIAAEDAEPPRVVEEYNLEGGLALGGYDPVSYFPEGGDKPRRGDEEITLTHREVTYRFVSEVNRERFTEDPERYEPAYGGWCAYAMAEGKQVEVDPKAFLIQNDRLMVFYRNLFTDTRKPWQKSPTDYEAKADQGWEEISGEVPPPDEES